MTTFKSHGIEVRTGEMSRATALACSREFNLLFAIAMTLDEWQSEIGAVLAVYAPATVVQDGRIVKTGEVRLDEDVSFALPLTREGFDNMPVTLANAWSEAAALDNQWLRDALLKALRDLTSTKNSEPLSGNAASSGPVPIPSTTTTAGGYATPNS